MIIRHMQGIIFDLDGVITDSALYHYQAWKMLADRLNIPFDEKYNENLKGVSRQESLELLLKNGNAQEKFSKEEKEALCTEKNDFYKELIKQITPKDVLPGVLEFVKEVKRRRIKMAIASVSRNANFVLDRLQIRDYFDYVCNPDEIKNPKPDPEIFLKAAKGINATPTSCVGIEDAEVGIDAINAAGMYSVGVGTPSKMKKAGLILLGTHQLRLSTIADAAKLKI